MKNLAIDNTQTNRKQLSVTAPTKNVFVVMSYTRVEQRIYEVFINEIDYNSLNGAGSYCVKISKHKMQEYVTEHRQSLAAIESMVDKPVHLIEFYTPKKVYLSTPLFTRIRFDGYDFVFQTNPAIAPYLQELAPKYTPYDLDVIQSLTSIYAVTMYKMLRMYECRKGKSFSYTIVELKQILQVEAGVYTDLTNFKNKTLETAKSEISNHPTHPIDFDYSTHAGFNNYRRQRNCTHVYFRIKNPTYHPSPLGLKDYEEYGHVFRSGIF